MTSPDGRQAAVETLVALGFTGLEAEVYAALVEESPATAYRIAQLIGKAAANVYKAVESLERRGVITVDDGDSRRLRAVAPVELLARVERDFDRARGRAQRALMRLRSAADDERVYSLQEREQVIERARAMLQRAEQLALVDVFPEPLDDLREALGEATARGVRVMVQVYARAEVPGATVVVAPHAPSLRKAWPAQWLNVVCDAREHLLALLRSGRGPVVQAVWSGSAYLSVLHHSGLVAELEKAALVASIREGHTNEQLREQLEAWASLSTSRGSLAGVTALQARLRADRGEP